MTLDWVVGDHLGLSIPAHPDALRDGGAAFLTDALRAAGSLADDACVRRIGDFREVDGGSTGRKVLLTVEYEPPQPRLPTDLFVKFSRDFDDPARDVGRTQMAAEVRFAELSRTPGFPIEVPPCLFGDYHRDSGTGMLVTGRITFGDYGIERQYHKCLDYEMPEPLAHYEALVTALARLSGTHLAGGLPAALTEQFPVDLQAATVGERIAVDRETLLRRTDRLADFVRSHPRLFPDSVRTPEFLARFVAEAPRVVAAEAQIWQGLADDSSYLALCHWNANVDNAWFWRDAADVLHCGLLDWGCVSQMHVAMAIWGALSAAEPQTWHHLDELLELFVGEVRRCGGPTLDPPALGRQVARYAALMGVTWLLNVPALVRSRCGNDTTALSRRDPLIADDEGLRAPLLMLANALHLWATRYPARAPGAQSG